MTAGLCLSCVMLWLYITPASKWQIKQERTSPILLCSKVSDIISNRCDSKWASRSDTPLFPSRGVGWPTTEKCWIFEATWVYWQKQQLFWRWGTSIFSSCLNPTLLLFIDPQTPRPVLAAKPKTNAETMCWCKCMGVDLLDPKERQPPTKFSTVCISFITVPAAHLFQETLQPQTPNQ